MIQAFKLLVGLIATLLLMLIVSVAWGRLRPPTTVQRQALATLNDVPASVAGHNVWATLWLIDYDVPADGEAAVYAREREAMESRAQHWRLDGPDPAPYVAPIAKDFPLRPALTEADRKQLCGNGDKSCLDKVRGDAPALRATLARHAGRLDRLRTLPRDAALWDDTPVTGDTPLINLRGVQELLATAAALDFVDGRADAGLAQVCANARTVRHMHAHTSSLLASAVTAAWMDSAERLLSEMLSELPSESALPTDCEMAFTPVVRADVDMCPAMQRQFQSIVLIADKMAASSAASWLFSAEGTKRLVAPVYVHACQPHVLAELLNDHLLSDDAMPVVGPDLFDQVSNPIGVPLARLSGNYHDLLNRNTDYAAGLRAMAWLLENRQPRKVSAWEQQLASAMPRLQRGGQRLIRIDPATAALTLSYVKPLGKRSAQMLFLPVPRIEPTAL